MLGRNQIRQTLQSTSRRVTVRCLSSKSDRRAFNFSAGPACMPTAVMQKAQREFLNWNNTGMGERKQRFGFDLRARLAFSLRSAMPGIMEMSHRDVGGPVQKSIERATSLLRDILSVPNDYHILFFQGLFYRLCHWRIQINLLCCVASLSCIVIGGAHAQFAAVPLNLLGDKKSGNYGISGFWSTRAQQEAARYCNTHVAFDCAKNGFKSIRTQSVIVS